MQKLVISPQAGLGNRLRALCSCAVFGSLIGREVLHYWVPDPIKGPAEHVNEVKGLEPQEVFDLGIKKFEGDRVDVCYTEWLPGEYWYESQSTAQRSLQCGEKRRLASSHEIAGCEAETVLIETSLEFELGSAKKYRVPLMANTYHTLFKLNERWNKLYETLPVFDCAVSVRRGDFLSYFPEADIPVGAVAERINKIDGTKIIFSDDIAYQAELRRLTYSFVGVSDMALMDEHLVTFFCDLEGQACHRHQGVVVSRTGSDFWRKRAGIHLMVGRDKDECLLQPAKPLAQDRARDSLLDCQRTPLGFRLFRSRRSGRRIRCAERSPRLAQS